MGYPCCGFCLEARMKAGFPHRLDSRLRGNDGAEVLE